jgi:integrase
MSVELVRSNEQFETQNQDPFVQKMVNVNGVPFDEEFLGKLVANHFSALPRGKRPTFSTAFEIYLAESKSSHRKRFRDDATRYFNYFCELYGDLPLDELKHWHITTYRDHQLQRGLSPSSIRKHHNSLNAILNLAFRFLDIDRLSPFRGLSIKGEGDAKRAMAVVTPRLIGDVKARLLESRSNYALIGLIQLNTGMRLSEPVFAMAEDCILDHPIPHLWIRQNRLSDRKTKSSIRSVPLYGASLEAAATLYEKAVRKRSAWLAPNYAKENGNGSCSAAMNKSLKDIGFRSHMFRHAFIDRLKACNDIPTRLAESITGHSSGGSEFNNYGTVGYTLEQKLEVIKRVAV